MFKKLIAVIATLIVASLALTACTPTPEKPKDPRVENVLVYDKELDNGLELQIYRIASGTITDKYATVMVKNKVGDKIVAVRYVLTNKTKNPVDIRNVTLWNANFTNSSNGIGTFNYSNTSLHSDLGFPTLPEAFEFSDSSKWMLEPGTSAEFAYDWIIDSKDMVMTYYIVFPDDKNVYNAEVDLLKDSSRN